MRKQGVIAGIAGVLIGGLTFGGVTAVHAASTGQPPQPVTVTNTATQPVPISQPAIPRTQFSVTEDYDTHISKNRQHELNHHFTGGYRDGDHCWK